MHTAFSTSRVRPPAGASQQPAPARQRQQAQVGLPGGASVCEGQGDDVWWRSVSARGGPEWSWGVAVRLTPFVAGCASAATVPPCRAV